MIIAEWLLGFLGFIGIVLITVISYFLKRLHFRIEEALKEGVKQNEKTMVHLHSIDVQIAGLSDIFRERVIEAVNILCKERQGACGLVQEERITAIKNKYTYLCNTFDELKKDRETAWGDQKKWNDKIERHLSTIRDRTS